MHIGGTKFPNSTMNSFCRRTVLFQQLQTCTTPCSNLAGKLRCRPCRQIQIVLNLQPLAASACKCCQLAQLLLRSWNKKFQEKKFCRILRNLANVLQPQNCVWLSFFVWRNLLNRSLVNFDFPDLATLKAFLRSGTADQINKHMCLALVSTVVVMDCGEGLTMVTHKWKGPNT